MLHPSPSSPAARVGLPPCWTQRRSLGHLFTFPLRSRPRPQIAFSLWLLATSSGAGTIARGNIRIASSSASPIYTRQVESSRLETLLHSRDWCARRSIPRLARTPHSSFRHKDVLVIRARPESCCELGIRSRAALHRTVDERANKRTTQSHLTI